METKIQKWGNSLGVRLPKSVAVASSLKEGVRVKVSESEGRVTIEALPESEVSLDEMLSAITDTNKHTEINWGEAKGNEIW